MSTAKRCNLFSCPKMMAGCPCCKTCKHAETCSLVCKNTPEKCGQVREKPPEP
ncbi:MAG: hypothetical protein LBR72_08475 [Oscillospiraceae bacterium]|nr:hypothetical protein [Oscillospiraceae bacterium]